MVQFRKWSTRCAAVDGVVVTQRSTGPGVGERAVLLAHPERQLHGGAQQAGLVIGGGAGGQAAALAAQQLVLQLPGSERAQLRVLVAVRRGE